jgi:D-threonate/D-erythronate kinase
MSARIAIIADDFTGLQAIAGEFRRTGFSVRTVLDAAAVPSITDADIIGIDTNSRALSRNAAVSAVNEAAKQLRAHGIGRIYKQCDSGMQGHIAAEAETLAQHLGTPTIVYAPACPSLGRVTRGGRQIMVGALKEQSPLDVDIVELWQKQTRNRPRSISVCCMSTDSPSGTVVVDAETDQELLQLAALCLTDWPEPTPLLVGSVGFANATALFLRLQDGKRDKPALIVTGSLQGQTMAQVETLKSLHGCDVVTVPPATNDTAMVEATVAAARASLKAGHHCLLASPHATNWQSNGRYPYIDETSLNAFNAAIVAVTKQLLSHSASDIAGVVVAGGMTSEFIIRDVLQATSTSISDWIAPGTTGAMAVDQFGRRTPFVTKAGTWGDADTLLRSVLWVQRHRIASSSEQ